MGTFQGNIAVGYPLYWLSQHTCTPKTPNAQCKLKMEEFKVVQMHPRYFHDGTSIILQLMIGEFRECPQLEVDHSQHFSCLQRLQVLLDHRLQAQRKHLPAMRLKAALFNRRHVLRDLASPQGYFN